jgi:hypothetical protein
MVVLVGWKTAHQKADLYPADSVMPVKHCALLFLLEPSPPQSPTDGAK